MYYNWNIVKMMSDQITILFYIFWVIAVLILFKLEGDVQNCLKLNSNNDQQLSKSSTKCPKYMVNLKHSKTGFGVLKNGKNHIQVLFKNSLEMSKILLWKVSVFSNSSLMTKGLYGN